MAVQIDSNAQAQELVRRVATGCQDDRGFGHFSVSIYDVAWLSMIDKVIANGTKQPLFPQCFRHLLQCQDAEGHWAGYASPIDSILNSLAGLLAIQTRLQDGVSTEEPFTNLVDRASKASLAISKLLELWRVDETEHVGFEILVPALLHLLEQNGTRFNFEGRKRLMDLHNAKLERLHPGYITSIQQTTALHSLEGFIGIIDFDKVSHHCTEMGGLLGSPSSTAAYLMHSSSWDERAERYLCNVVKQYGDSGLVPSAYPSTVFEASWVLSTFLANGYTVTDLGSDSVAQISQYLATTLQDQNGITGFVPGFLPDADDTARTILSLQLLKKPTNPGAMAREFFQRTHFKTYHSERNPSFSANCNVLLALLACERPGEFTQEITACLTFLHSLVMDGNIKDKWNLRNEYSEMLLCEAFVQAMCAYSECGLDGTSDLLTVDLPLDICRLVSRAVSEQSVDGSWHSSCETTAYRILLLSHSLAMPWADNVRHMIQIAVAKGKIYLLSRKTDWAQGEYFWIEKVTYKSSILAEAYCLAAARSTQSAAQTPEELKAQFSSSVKIERKLVELLRSLPMLQDLKEASISLALIEARLLTRAIYTIRLNIFPRDEMAMETDSYLKFIPILWILANKHSGFPLSGTVIWQMIVISMLNFQADEFMETAVAACSEPCNEVLRTEIESECRISGPTPASPSSHYTTTALTGAERYASYPSSPPTPPQANESNSFKLGAEIFDGVSKTLQRYIGWVKKHPALLRCPEDAQEAVLNKLHKFLLAHMAHNIDNKNLRFERASTSSKPAAVNAIGRHSTSSTRKPYFDWVHSTGADDTSCPYSFAFFTCLISKDSIFSLPSAKAKYFGQAMAMHLATMCRQYNDLGSRTRDGEEGNLNSMDFVELQQSASKNASTDTLMALAEFERGAMENAFRSLSTEISLATQKAIRAFVNVTDLFGQIYVAKDIASRRKD